MRLSDFKSTQINLVKSEYDFDRLKLLFLEYAISIDFDLNYKDFLQEMASISELYSPPTGIGFILSHHDRTVGGVGIMRSSNDTAVIKRLYTRAEFRHPEYLRQLISVATDWARQWGCRRLRANPSDIMISAVKNLQPAGFREILMKANGSPLPSPLFEIKLAFSEEMLDRVAS